MLFGEGQTAESVAKFEREAGDRSGVRDVMQQAMFPTLDGRNPFAPLGNQKKPLVATFYWVHNSKASLVVQDFVHSITASIKRLTSVQDFRLKLATTFGASQALQSFKQKRSLALVSVFLQHRDAIPGFFGPGSNRSRG